jgi:hypothetical protein
MGPYTTDDLNRRFNEASSRAANGIELGFDPYDAAAFGGPGKAAFAGYPAQVAAVIGGDGRIRSIFNQGRNLEYMNLGVANRRD